MKAFQIRQGRNIHLKGAASKEIKEMPLPPKAAIQLGDFRGIKPRVLIKEGDYVKVGSHILEDKNIPDIKIVSPISGKVSAINRGEKRVLLSVVVDSDGRQETVEGKRHSPQEVSNLSRQDIINTLLHGGVWPFIRQRPFSKIANPKDQPKAIFIQGMNTEPLALDVDTVLQGREGDFQIGLDIIRKLTSGKTNLCISPSSKSKALLEAKNVEIYKFAGPHPAGNVSTHIHHIDPIRKGDIVWYINAFDVLRVAALLVHGKFSSEKYVAITGEGVQNRVYVKTVIGATFNQIVKTSSSQEKLRYISGSVLTGTSVGRDGYLGFYDSQVTVIPEGGKRRLLGWLTPGLGSYSFTKTFVSSFLPERAASLDTDTNGSERAIVLNNVYDSLVPLDIMTYFLLKAILIGDIEEQEKLGILECDEEDFALCTFACVSKVDVGGIVRRGLDVIQKEG